MEKTKYDSYKNNKLAKGCLFCVKGRKLVLFITGVCGNDCFYCPLSDEKFKKDVIYANEMPIIDLKDAVKEAKLCSSTGAGITGGDPLTKLPRTIKAIKLLKKEFGKSFHIHLYTNLIHVNEKTIKQLEEAGLDEIRFHPSLEQEKLWENLKVKTKIPKGIEIPTIPGKEKITYKLIEFAKDHIDFLNLNELEYSDAEHTNLAELGYKPKDEYSYGVKGSEEMAFKILEKYPDMNIHYCTTKLKNSVQLMNRIELRAKNIKKPYEIQRGPVLIKGAVYLKELTPDFGFQKKLKNANKKDILNKLKIAKQELSKHLKNLDIDENKLRLITSKQEIKQKAKVVKKLGYVPYIAEELATYDQFELESEEL